MGTRRTRTIIAAVTGVVWVAGCGVGPAPLGGRRPTTVQFGAH